MVAHVRLGTAIAFPPKPHLDHIGMPPDVVALRVEGLAPAAIRLVWRKQESSRATARFVHYATTAHAAAA
uniref:hypothetical protein n=1 Tax=Paractinoplanes polyasparticus TaxID=2856853 RepID=UPI001C8413AB|nr:hypothetical protein [Actinoplanes polyasparticus]